jgi:hypothetical protein
MAFTTLLPVAKEGKYFNSLLMTLRDVPDLRRKTGPFLDQ